MGPQRRLRHVRAATSAAICHMNLESAKLKKRIDTLGCQLGIALGDLDGIYYEREPEDEKILTTLESRLLEISKRSSDLDRQLAVLQDIAMLLHDQ